MRKLHEFTVSRLTEAEPSTTWNVISDPDVMARWTPYRQVTLEKAGAPEPNGVGAVRAMRGFGPTVRERITTFEPPARMRYELVAGLPFRDYTGEITVEPHNSGSRITCVIRFRTVVPGSQVLGAFAVWFATTRAAREATRRA
ncbi:MAG: SRPBCC family protein [Nocardiaceae bacterium]|nr:SRPBCC family protein [Nocardiaceae bacterium]